MDAIQFPPATAVPVNLLLVREGFGDGVEIFSGTTGAPITLDEDWEALVLELMEDGVIHFNAMTQERNRGRALVLGCVATQVLARKLMRIASNDLRLLWACHAPVYDVDSGTYGGIFTLVVESVPA